MAPGWAADAEAGAEVDLAVVAEAVAVLAGLVEADSAAAALGAAGKLCPQ